MTDAYTQTPVEPAVQDPDAKLRSLRAAVAELAAGENMEKATALETMEPDEWAALMDIYTTMRRRHDPLCGPAKRFTILPVSLAASLALTRRHRDMLVALGRRAPRKWDAEVAYTTTTRHPTHSYTCVQPRCPPSIPRLIS